MVEIIRFRIDGKVKSLSSMPFRPAHRKTGRSKRDNLSYCSELALARGVENTPMAMLYL